jgi:cytochrome c
MKHLQNLIASSVVIAASLASSAALASKELAQSKNCLACHAAEKKIIGPSIKSIAEKYPAADAGKIAALAKKVREGGVGVWGAIPMAANPQVNSAESETLVKWFLAGGK